MEIEHDITQENPETGRVETLHTHRQVASAAAVESASMGRAASYIWYVAGLIDTLLLLRLLFLLFGANNTGFASALYSLTLPLESAFKGIFPAPGAPTGYFDTAALLAMIIYALIAWGIVSLIHIASRRKTA